MNIDHTIKLNTGSAMPIIGLGTWKSAPDDASKAVEYALTEAGYNHIDCAAIYNNEQEIGRAFKKVFVNETGTNTNTGTRNREDVFITSKLWNTEHAKDRVRKACEQTLADLNLEYLDLYLMHWGIAEPPTISVRETWEAMEQLVEAGLVKAIGVANFTAPMLVDLMSYAKIPPAVNQIELHPYLQQQALVDFCKYSGIALTAYSPLGTPGNSKGKGLPILLEDNAIVDIADSHNKSPAQVLIRWGMQREIVVIPKSVTPERIKENIDVFDFELSPLEMEAIAGLNRNQRFVDPSVWWKIPYFN